MCKSREELSKIVKFWPFYNPALVPMWARVMSFIVYVLLTPKLHHIKFKRFQEQVKTVKYWQATDKKSIAIGYLSFQNNKKRKEKKKRKKKERKNFLFASNQFFYLEITNF